MASAFAYVEESFGILTDDDLYLDCILVKPTNASDEDLRILRVWVPKYPLTKTSIITCARQEVKSYGPDGKIAHLVFDLRGTGDSEGILGDQSYHLDLIAIKEWAKERFDNINFGFLGFPTIAEIGTVNVWPLRAGAIIESYLYHAAGKSVSPASILYLSSYGNFTHKDEAICVALSDAGYNVYGIDPYRYLLHANAKSPLTPETLQADLRELIQMLPNLPIIIAQPLAAGLAIVWASAVERVRGVIAIGRAQAGLKPAHIFDNTQPATFQITRHIANIAPRPLVLVLRQDSRARTEKELRLLYKNSKTPNRLERTDKITPELLLDLVKWAEDTRALGGS